MTRMHRRVLPLLFAALTLLGLSSVRAPVWAQSAATPPNKLVFQVSESDPRKWGLALNNVMNTQAMLGQDQVAIELVAYGPGIDMLKADSVAGSRLQEVMARGVKVVACEMTMKNMKLEVPDMQPRISYAPSGVVELMKKQQEGYAYIRP